MLNFLKFKFNSQRIIKIIMLFWYLSSMESVNVGWLVVVSLNVRRNNKSSSSSLIRLTYSGHTCYYVSWPGSGGEADTVGKTKQNNKMILFISTGGTIDKLYPRTVRLQFHKTQHSVLNWSTMILSGYSFEFGPPAVENILGRIKPKLYDDYK